MPGVDGFDVFYGGFPRCDDPGGGVASVSAVLSDGQKINGRDPLHPGGGLHSLDPVWRGSLPACYCGMADAWSVGFPVPETMGKTEND